jgi:hypothetical protein
MEYSQGNSLSVDYLIIFQQTAFRGRTFLRKNPVAFDTKVYLAINILNRYFKSTTWI